MDPAQPQLDPEQLRQFQQFQQFQDFLRYTEAQRQVGSRPAAGQDAPIQSAPGYGPQPGGDTPGQLGPAQPGHLTPWQPGTAQPSHLAPTQSGHLTPAHHGGPPAPPPPHGQLQPAPLPQPGPKIKAPRWAKRLAGKLLSALLFLLVLIIAGKLAYDHFFPSDDPDLPASQTGGGTYHTNKIFSTSPYESVRMVYAQIAQNRPDLACGSFDIPVQQKFAEDLGYPDCRHAVLAVKAQVTDVNGYAESIPSSVSEPPASDTVTIDSCRFVVRGGPALGVFTAQRVEKGQWLITAHQPGPRTCPLPSTPASPTTSSSR